MNSNCWHVISIAVHTVGMSSGCIKSSLKNNGFFRVNSAKQRGNKKHASYCVIRIQSLNNSLQGPTQMQMTSLHKFWGMVRGPCRSRDPEKLKALPLKCLFNPQKEATKQREGPRPVSHCPSSVMSPRFFGVLLGSSERHIFGSSPKNRFVGAQPLPGHLECYSTWFIEALQPSIILATAFQP